MSVEVAGPTLPTTMPVEPNTFRGMAGWVIEHCIQARGIGGFVTNGFKRTVDFVTNPESDIEQLYRKLFGHDRAFSLPWSF